MAVGGTAVGGTAVGGIAELVEVRKTHVEYIPGISVGIRHTHTHNTHIYAYTYDAAYTRQL